MAELKETANKVQSKLEEKQISKAWFVVQERETQEFNMENGDFSLFRTLFDKALSVTTYQNQKKGVSTTNKLDDAAIEETIQAALVAAESAEADEAYDIAPKQENQSFEVGCYEPDLEKLFMRTKEFAEDIAKEFPKIQVMLMMVSHEKLHEIYRNTNGTEFETLGGKYLVIVEYSAGEGDKNTSVAVFGVASADLDRPFMEMGATRKLFENTQKQLETTTFEGKFEGTVVFMPDCLANFLNNLMMNYVGDGVILEKTSRWMDKIGQQVADKRISISLNPMDERVVEYERYTADGFVSEPYDLIRNGELKSFMNSLYVANKTGGSPAKNASHNIIMEAGDTSFQDLIKGVKKGLLLGGFSGGTPGTSGDFSGVAKNSFLIEDGEIKGAVNEVMVNGNLGDMLNHVVGISKELVMDGESVLPYLAVDGIVISGK